MKVPARAALGHGEDADERSGLPELALPSLAAGAVTGLVGAVFRLSLDRADQVRDVLLAWAHPWGVAGLGLVTAACAVATAVAAWMARRLSPHASGSGIPHVEAVLRGELPPAPVSLVPVKFAGGVLAIGPGLVLGREGPGVQMGATLSHLVGVAFRRDRRDCRALLAAGAGAGLAAAFNAPIAGAVFVHEELVRRFETRTAVAALGASGMAIAVSRLFLGDLPDFTVDPLAYAGGAQKGALFLVLGVVAGFLAVVYNRTLLGTLAVANRLKRWPVELRAGLIGAAVGVLARIIHLSAGGWPARRPAGPERGRGSGVECSARTTPFPPAAFSPCHMPYPAQKCATAGRLRTCRQTASK